MTPSHAAAIGALAATVTVLRMSKAKDSKAVLASLDERCGAVMVDVEIYLSAIDSYDDDSALTKEQWVHCALVMGLNIAALPGAKPCIRNGRYAIRTEDGLKLGPKVSP